MRGRSRPIAMILVVPALALAGCGGTTPPTSPSSSSGTTPSSSAAPVTPTPSPTPSPATSPTSTAGPALVTKLMVLVVENHSLDEMRRQMPSVARLAEQFGYADHYTAASHPSLPNYLAIAGGSTFGVTDDRDPSSHPIHGASVFGQALQAGRTARVYAEGMTSPCATASGGDRYAVRHNPWTYFVDERRACALGDLPMTGLAADAAAGRLPNAGMIVPNLCNDAHDCSLTTADAWLRARLDTLMAGPDWAAGRLAIVVTADEDDHSQGNTVFTLVLHPALRHVAVHTPLTHFSLTRFYDEVLGVPFLRSAAGAASMARAFGLPVASS